MVIMTMMSAETGFEPAILKELLFEYLLLAEWVLAEGLCTLVFIACSV